MAIFHSSTGAAYPDDLKLLKDIYDDICTQRGLRRGSAAAEILAREAMDLFSQGVFDEADIRESLKLFLERKELRN
ncbi:hypothetical protein CYK37_08900 [Mesorhizobium loti]|nr:hypothetical protein [Mesorhizobium loti]PLP59433.1 hypothetical protein CYK37_08900 [Mesorhizobium loti]